MLTDTPIITTVIPTYRRPELLHRAIRSVLAQSYPHPRVCVYDNASGDETAATVAALAREDERISYHCHPTNIGPTANFAYGIERIDTPFFSLLPDDDYYLPEFFAIAMAGFPTIPMRSARQRPQSTSRKTVVSFVARPQRGTSLHQRD